MQQVKKHRFSKLFRLAFKAFTLYLLLWVIALVCLLIGVICDFLPAILSVVILLVPTLIRLGFILFICTIFVIIYEGLR